MAKAVTFEMFRFKEAKESFRQAALAMDPASANTLRDSYKRASGEIQEGFRRAALTIRDAAKSNAASSGAPRRLWSGVRPAIFAFSDFDSAKDDRRKRSVLVGVRTGLSYRAKQRELYIQWRPAGNTRKKDESKLGHGGLSMSFGALFEKGTANGRVRARHYFQSAIASASSQVLHMVTLAYQRATEHLNRDK